jgi:hypothetical protein
MTAIWRMTAGAALVLFAALAVLSKVWLEPPGQVIFDSRVTGYDLAAATAFLDVLNDDQRRLYLGVFRTLDTAFPLLLALSLGMAVTMRSAAGWSARAVFALMATVAYLAADLSENMLVAQILREEGALDAALVSQASALTISKWVTLAVALYLTVLTWLKTREA